MRLGLSMSLPLLVWSAVWLAPRSGLALPPIALALGRPLLLLLTHGIVAFVAQGALNHAIGMRSATWSYRDAFIPSVMLALGVWSAFSLVSPPLPWLWLLGAGVGALLGGFAATARADGLREASFIPSPTLQDEVRRRHDAWLAMPVHEPWTKRVFDLTGATLLLIVSAPFWLTCLLLIWLEDPGPIFFIKNSVGKGGVTFQQLKFRTMIRNAEAETGPIPARQKDDRVLLVGRVLRKTNLDELPQIINIARGEMSFVGPRPLRTVVVRDLLDIIPQWAERHAVRPGIAGVAQVIGGYYTTPLQKLRFDRIYIRNISVWFDLRLLLAAMLIAFWLRWREGWNGRVPRRLIHGDAPVAGAVTRRHHPATRRNHKASEMTDVVRAHSISE